jgi:hypothetical protein
MRNWCERVRVMRVHNQARNFIDLIGDDLLTKERPKRQVGECKLSRHASFFRLRGHPCQKVAAPQRRRLRHQRSEIGEVMALSSDSRRIHSPGS